MFVALRARAVACVTWIKGERWPDSEFAPTEVPLHTPWGVRTKRGQLAQRPLELLDGDLSAHEIRFGLDGREQPSGHRQPALVTTHPSLPAAEAAGLLYPRWAKENVFKTLR